LKRSAKKVKTKRMQSRLWIPYETLLRETDLESEYEDQGMEGEVE
jgi:hypothetical protein